MTQQTKSLSSTSILIWRIVQAALFIVGIGMLILMMNDTLQFIPGLDERFGRDVFWNVLIFAAPLLLAIAPGLWRNICPLGTTSLFPKYLGISKNKVLSQVQQGNFYIIAIVLLIILVPLRHVETSGLTVTLAIAGVAVVALVTGYLYKDKSGFCNGICPVLPVEKLYGTKPLITLPNSHCSTCTNCVSPCPDSNVAEHPASMNGKGIGRKAGFIFIGGFPGFVWGWFQITDYAIPLEGWQNLLHVYGLPMLGFAATLVLYWALTSLVGKERQLLVTSIYAAAAISIYYWYRIPAIMGFDATPGVFGVDLSASLPNFPVVSRVITILFFFWWFVLRNNTKLSWELRPPYSSNVQSQPI